jgi:hypothetical protein
MLTLEMPGRDVDLVKQQQKINLHLIINIGHGIPLLPAEDRARPALGAPRQPPRGLAHRREAGWRRIGSGRPEGIGGVHGQQGPGTWRRLTRLTSAPLRAPTS